MAPNATSTAWRASGSDGPRVSVSQLSLLLCLRASVIGGSVLLWMSGHASPGDVTYVLTSYYVIHAYLRDVGMHINVSGGRVMVDGQDIAHATQQSLRSQVAIVQQEPILFHRSLAENIAYGRPAPAWRRSSSRRGWRTRTTSSCACRRATARWSASAA